MESARTSPERPASKARKWAIAGLVLALYAASVGLATYPRFLHFRHILPGHRSDPLQHLWIMRWYKSCLLQGRLPNYCPDLQYPVGAPLGNFSPLEFQFLLYLPLSTFLKNDTLIYNILWLVGFLLTGMGTYLLGVHVLRDRACAAVGGLLAMLSAPMMLRAHGHLELQYLGAFPIFLVAWMRFVDRPGLGRLLAAVAAYTFLALCAAYYAVYGAFPAALYAGWMIFKSVKTRDWPRLRSLTLWLAGFAALALPMMALTFANQLWSRSHGYAQPKTMAEFTRYSAPLWSYLAPTGGHRISAILPGDPFAASGRSVEAFEETSYLGVVSLGLIAYAAIRRPRSSDRAGYWWAALGMLVVLSCGADWRVGAYHLPLPGAWLKRHFFAFQAIRCPSRFNLLAAVVASLIAAAGLKEWLSRTGGRAKRAAIVAGLSALAVADLSLVPFMEDRIPDLPAAYRTIVGRDPKATILDAPVVHSDAAHTLAAACTYWQALHGARTTAGYSGNANIVLDDLFVCDSPFALWKLQDAGYGRSPGGETFSIARGVDVGDYAWLYLKAHGLRYVVLHRRDGFVPELPMQARPLLDRLAPGRIFEDGSETVYDRDLLPAPSRPVLLLTDGWRWTNAPWAIPASRALAKVGKLKVYSPGGDRELRFAMEAAAFRGPRVVALKADGEGAGPLDDRGTAASISASSPPRSACRPASTN